MKRPVANSCLSCGDKSSRFNGLLLESLHLFAAESHGRHIRRVIARQNTKRSWVRDLHLSRNNVSTSPNRLHPIASRTFDEDHPFKTHHLGDFSTHVAQETKKEKNTPTPSTRYFSTRVTQADLFRKNTSVLLPPNKSKQKNVNLLTYPRSCAQGGDTAREGRTPDYSRSARHGGPPAWEGCPSSAGRT